MQWSATTQAKEAYHTVPKAFYTEITLDHIGERPHECWLYATQGRFQPPLQQELLERDDQIMQLKRAVQALPQQMRSIVAAYWGLDGAPPTNYALIGQSIGCSRETVRKRELEARKRLRRRLRNPF